MTLQLNHHFTVPELKCILIPFFHDVVNLSKPQAKIDLRVIQQLSGHNFAIS